MLLSFYFFLRCSSLEFFALFWFFALFGFHLLGPIFCKQFELDCKKRPWPLECVWWVLEKESKCVKGTCSCLPECYFGTLFWDDITKFWDENLLLFTFLTGKPRKNLFWTNKKCIYLNIITNFCPKISSQWHKKVYILPILHFINVTAHIFPNKSPNQQKNPPLCQFAFFTYNRILIKNRKLR